MVSRVTNCNNSLEENSNIGLGAISRTIDLRSWSALEQQEISKNKNKCPAPASNLHHDVLSNVKRISDDVVIKIYLLVCQYNSNAKINQHILREDLEIPILI